ncbi:MAG: SRPBCC family protein [Solirubrobacteraceae bacterium]
MITQRTRDLAATREKLWDIVGDPYHEPRWWPRVQRVERVTARGWTSVMTSARGNAVRADWVVEANEQPTRRRWSQEVENTPFERLFERNAVEVHLERAPDGTRVTVLFDQQPRGLARVMPFMLRRAMGRQLDAALDGLAQAAG